MRLKRKKITIRFFYKIISLFTASTFLFSSIAFAIPQEKSITQDKNREIITNPASIVIPAECGLVKSRFTGNNDTLVIHIQDAHCNYEAQTNIARIIEALVKNYNLNFVSVEGADGTIDTSWFKAFPDEEVRKEVANYFMKKGEITGPEFLSITTDYPIKLFGAETRSYYIENLNAFTSSYTAKDETEKYFNQIKTVLGKLKNYIYSEELKTLDQKTQDYESKKFAFNEYVRFLQDACERHKINLRGYDNFFKLISALIYEKRIDFNIVDKERSTLIDEVSKKISKDALADLVSQSLSFKIGKISSVEYYDYLKDLSLKNGIEIAKKYPNLSNYIIYNSVYSKIENEKLFKDIKDVETAIKEKLFTNDDQRTLDKLSYHIDILLGLVNIKLLNGDFEYYLTHKVDFSHEVFLDFINKKGVQYGLAFEAEYPSDAVAKSIPKLEDFYSIAIKRDRALVDNTLGEMKKEKKQIAVLVTGGFHSEGITKLLENKGVSYMVICPTITKDAPTNYIKILTNQKSSFEDILVGTAEAKAVDPKQGLVAVPLISKFMGVGDATLKGYSKWLKDVNGRTFEDRVREDREAWINNWASLVIPHVMEGVKGTRLTLDNIEEGLIDLLADRCKKFGISASETGWMLSRIQAQFKFARDAFREEAIQAVRASASGLFRVDASSPGENNFFKQELPGLSKSRVALEGAGQFELYSVKSLESRVAEFNMRSLAQSLPTARLPQVPYVWVDKEIFYVDESLLNGLNVNTRNALMARLVAYRELRAGETPLRELWDKYKKDQDSKKEEVSVVNFLDNLPAMISNYGAETHPDSAMNFVTSNIGSFSELKSEIIKLESQRIIDKANNAITTKDETALQEALIEAYSMAAYYFDNVEAAAAEKKIEALKTDSKKALEEKLRTIQKVSTITTRQKANIIRSAAREDLFKGEMEVYSNTSLRAYSRVIDNIAKVAEDAARREMCHNAVKAAGELYPVWIRTDFMAGFSSQARLFMKAQFDNYASSFSLNPKKDVIALIMAGGGGERMFPISTKTKPKQLADIVDKPLLIMAVERVVKDLGAENVYIQTIPHLREAVYDLLKDHGILRDHIFAEPKGADTAGAIGYAAAKLTQLGFGEKVMFVGTANHYIDVEQNHPKRGTPSFATAYLDAARIAKVTPTIGTIGIDPKPIGISEDYGCIKQGEKTFFTREEAVVASTFIEKPKGQKAIDIFNTLLPNNKHTWLYNSGMFVGRPSSFLEAFDESAPVYGRGFHAIASASFENSSQVEAEVFDLLAGFKKDGKFNHSDEIGGLRKGVSVDYVLAQPLSRNETSRVALFMVPGKFKWMDIGSYKSAHDYYQSIAKVADGAQNVILSPAPGNIILDNCTKCLVSIRDGKVRAKIEGVNNLLVIYNPATKALLIAPITVEGDLIKKVLKKIEEEHPELLGYVTGDRAQINPTPLETMVMHHEEASGNHIYQVNVGRVMVENCEKSVAEAHLGFVTLIDLRNEVKVGKETVDFSGIKVTMTAHEGNQDTPIITIEKGNTAAGGESSVRTSTSGALGFASKERRIENMVSLAAITKDIKPEELTAERYLEQYADIPDVNITKEMAGEEARIVKERVARQALPSRFSTSGAVPFDLNNAVNITVRKNMTEVWAAARKKYSDLQDFPMPLLGTSGERGTSQKQLTDVRIITMQAGNLSMLAERYGVRPGDAIVFAGDLRPSTPRIVKDAILSALQQRFDVNWQGFVSTPTVVFWATTNGKPMVSIMVTASHNPVRHEKETAENMPSEWENNGLKLNSPGGEVYKEDEPPLVEHIKEAELLQAVIPWNEDICGPDGKLKTEGLSIEQKELLDKVSRIFDNPGTDAREAYRLRNTTQMFGKVFDGEHVGFNEHTGVARDALPEILREVGLDVHTYGRDFSGKWPERMDTEDLDKNIEKHMKDEAERLETEKVSVLSHNSTDGDADRPALFDSKGNFIYGDKICGLSCIFLKELFPKKDFVVVVTATCNEAMVKLLREEYGMKVIKVEVGSPYVVSEMEKQAKLNKAAIVVGFERNTGFFIQTPITLPNGNTIQKLATRDSAFVILSVNLLAKKRGAKALEGLVDSEYKDEYESYSWSGGITNATPGCEAYTAPMGKAIMRSLSPRDRNMLVIEFDKDNRVFYTTRDAYYGLKKSGNRVEAAIGVDVSRRMLVIRDYLRGIFTEERGFDAISKMEFIDGVRVFFNSGEIVHLRPSGNEPKWRIYPESPREKGKRARDISEMRLEIYPKMIKDYVRKTSANANMRIEPRDAAGIKESLGKLVPSLKIPADGMLKTWEMKFGPGSEHFLEKGIEFARDGKSFTVYSMRTYNKFAEGKPKSTLSVSLTSYPDERRVVYNEVKDSKVVIQAEVKGEKAWVELGVGLDKNVPVNKFQDMIFPVMPQETIDKMKESGVVFLRLLDMTSENELEPSLWGPEDAGVFEFARASTSGEACISQIKEYLDKTPGRMKVYIGGDRENLTATEEGFVRDLIKLIAERPDIDVFIGDDSTATDLFTLEEMVKQDAGKRVTIVGLEDGWRILSELKFREYIDRGMLSRERVNRFLAGIGVSGDIGSIPYHAIDSTLESKGVKWVSTPGELTKGLASYQDKGAARGAWTVDQLTGQNDFTVWVSTKTTSITSRTFARAEEKGKTFVFNRNFPQGRERSSTSGAGDISRVMTGLTGLVNVSDEVSASIAQEEMELSETMRRIKTKRAIEGTAANTIAIVLVDNKLYEDEGGYANAVLTELSGVEGKGPIAVIRGTGEGLVSAGADAIQKAEAMGLSVRKVVAQVSSRSDAALKAKLAEMGVVLSIDLQGKNLTEYYVQMLRIFDLSFKIAYDFKPEDISITLSKITGKDITVEDMARWLALKIIEILPRLIKIDTSAAVEAYKAVKQALTSL